MNSKDELVSVVIPCYNAEPWIAECLDSVIAQTYRPMEVIVVDDGSTDGSASVVADRFPQVTLIRTENRGVSAARNTGVEASTGVFVQFLDADDTLAADKLIIQVSALETTSADVAYGPWIRERRDTHNNVIESLVVDRSLGGDPDIDLFTDFWCPPAAYLFRREIVEQAGGMRSDLPIIQDARFVLDCALLGARFAYCDSVVATYRDHATGSLSKRDAMAFMRDILVNANGVEDIWRSTGKLDEPHRNALTKAYAQVARSSFGRFPDLFDQAFAALEALSTPGRYVPSGPRHLVWASRILGYPRAERIAYWYRQVKSFLCLLRTGSHTSAYA